MADRVASTARSGRASEPTRWSRIRTNYAMLGAGETFRRGLVLCAYVVVARLSKALTKAQSDFDAAHGTTTDDWVEVNDGALPATAAANAIRYVPTRPELVRHICTSLPIEHQRFTFVDLGSGRGRALLVAAEYPFKAVVGVEVSPLHHEVALRNIDIYHAQRELAAPISALCMDVMEYELPDGDLVIYMYQPFTGVVFEAALDKIAAVRDRAVFLCCSSPWRPNRRLLDEHQSLRALRSYGILPFARIEGNTLDGVSLALLQSQEDWYLYANETGQRLFEGGPDR